MAPVTRRAAKAQGETPRESPTNTPITAKSDMLFEEPIALRSKRKPSNNTSEEGAKVETPRRQELEVRTREEPTSTIEVQIPSSAARTPRPRSSPVPDSQETDASDEGNQTFEPLSASKQLEDEATQKLATQSRSPESSQEETPLPKAARSTRGSSAKKSRDKPTSLENSESEAEEMPRPKPAKSTHVVFGDDDDVDKFVAAAAEKEKDAVEANGGDDDQEEQEDSDDEAPEAVSTAAAAKETLKSTRAAIEAAEQYILPPLVILLLGNVLMIYIDTRRRRKESVKRETTSLSNRQRSGNGRNTAHQERKSYQRTRRASRKKGGTSHQNVKDGHINYPICYQTSS